MFSLYSNIWLNYRKKSYQKLSGCEWIHCIVLVDQRQLCELQSHSNMKTCRYQRTKEMAKILDRTRSGSMNSLRELILF